MGGEERVGQEHKDGVWIPVREAVAGHRLEAVDDRHGHPVFAEDRATSSPATLCQCFDDGERVV